MTEYRPPRLMSGLSRDPPTNPHRATALLAAVSSLTDVFHHAAAPMRICTSGSLSSRACGIAGPGVPPPLRLRGILGDASPDIVGVGGGVAGDEGTKMGGESAADQQRLFVVAVREEMEGGESGRGGGIRYDAHIQEREVCANLPNPGGSRDDEFCEEDSLRGHARGERADVVLPSLAAGGIHSLGERRGKIQRPEEESEVDLSRRVAPYKRSAAAGTSGSPALLVTSDMKVFEDVQSVTAEERIGSNNKQIEIDPGGSRESDDGGYTGCLVGIRPGGRLWALEQIEEDDGDCSEEDEVSPSPYLATFADAFACAKKEEENRSETEWERAWLVFSKLLLGLALPWLITR